MPRLRPALAALSALLLLPAGAAAVAPAAPSAAPAAAMTTLPMWSCRFTDPADEVTPERWIGRAMAPTAQVAAVNGRRLIRYADQAPALHYMIGRKGWGCRSVESFDDIDDATLVRADGSPVLDWTWIGPEMGGTGDGITFRCDRAILGATGCRAERRVIADPALVSVPATVSGQSACATSAVRLYAGPNAGRRVVGFLKPGDVFTADNPARRSFSTTAVACDGIAGAPVYFFRIRTLNGLTVSTVAWVAASQVRPAS